MMHSSPRNRSEVMFSIMKALQTVSIEESGKRFSIRSQCQGVCGKVFQAVGVALPPTIREL
jgi:hypothetical protein